VPFFILSFSTALISSISLGSNLHGGPASTLLANFLLLSDKTFRAQIRLKLMPIRAVNPTAIDRDFAGTIPAIKRIHGSHPNSTER